jgi:hypothetical protein
VDEAAYRPAAPDSEGPDERELRRAAANARWAYVRIPLLALLVMLGIGVPPAALHYIVYTQVVPIFLVIAAFFVLFIGAWYDFGAKKHVQEVLDARLPFTEGDLVHIHKQQLLLTAAYVGVAGLYILVAVAIAAFA